jgi:hypothetical protein
MTAKRKWRTVTSTAGARPKSHPSQPAVYRFVNQMREAFTSGVSSASQVTVYVDEGMGAGWELYERCDFLKGDWA